MNYEQLSNADVFNLALQRTSSLFTLPIRTGVSPSYFAWSKLKLDFPLKAEVSFRRAQILRQCEAEILDEVANFVKFLDDDRPMKIVDIGPGIGLHAAAMSSRLKISDILLIDIEKSNSRHHGWASEGAGYNSLESAKAFIREQNESVDIVTVNPKKDTLSRDFGHRFDLIMSFLSCGFHYPADIYLNFYKQHLDHEQGKLVLDLRRGIDHSTLLEHFTVVETIEKGEKHDRVILHRSKK